MKKIAIFGSREIDTEAVTNILNEMMSKEIWYITSGNIKGAAECARNVASDKGIKITLYNYESGLGFYAALKDITTKNKKMVQECDEALVFWNGESKGTEREIKMLKKENKPYRLFKIEKKENHIDIKTNSFRDQIMFARTSNNPKELETLSQSSYWQVRYEVSRNSNTPEIILLNLVNDNNLDVQKQCKIKLKLNRQ